MEFRDLQDNRAYLSADSGYADAGYAEVIDATNVTAPDDSDEEGFWDKHDPFEGIEAHVAPQRSSGGETAGYSTLDTGNLGLVVGALGQLAKGAADLLSNPRQHTTEEIGEPVDDKPVMDCLGSPENDTPEGQLSPNPDSLHTDGPASEILGQAPDGAAERERQPHSDSDGTPEGEGGDTLEEIGDLLEKLAAIRTLLGNKEGK